MERARQTGGRRQASAAQQRRDALWRELRRKQPLLPKRLGEVARYLLEHPTEAALETVATLAGNAGAQPSTLVRLAQALGFPGFSDLQALLRAALAEAAPSYGERIRRRTATSTGLLRQLCELNEVSLQHLAGTPQSSIDDAVRLLAGAEAVHLLGLRRSHAVAVHLAYGLTRAGKFARLLSGAGGFLREELAAMRRGHVLVAISVQPYSAEVIQACATARECGATVLALTDGALSPLAPLARSRLDVQDAELWGFRSLVAQMCLTQALVLGVTAELQTQTEGSAGD